MYFFILRRIYWHTNSLDSLSPFLIECYLGLDIIKD